MGIHRQAFAYEKGRYVVLTPEDFKKAGGTLVRGAEIIDLRGRSAVEQESHPELSINARRLSCHYALNKCSPRASRSSPT